MKLFRELLLSGVGRAAIVIGGGMSAPEQVARAAAAYPDALRISANAHGGFLGDVDYMASIDDVHAEIRATGNAVPFISHHPWADYRLVEQPQLDNSGCLATWVAWNLGAAPILLCGMDCYLGGDGNVYFHDQDAESTGTRLDWKAHARNWARLAASLPDSAPVRTMGGPLEGVFDLFDPLEDFSGYVPPSRQALLRETEGKRVRFTRETRIGDELFLVGQVVELPLRDARRAVQQKRAVPARA